MADSITQEVKWTDPEDGTEHDLGKLELTPQGIEWSVRPGGTILRADWPGFLLQLTYMEPDLKRFRVTQWEPGDLSQTDLRRILRDAAAELWVDSYRRGDLTGIGRERRFQEMIAAELYAATGKTWLLRRMGQ